MSSPHSSSPRLVVRPVADVPEFAALLRRLARRRLPVVLDSAGGPAALSRYSVFGFDPFRTLSHAGGLATVTSGDRGGLVTVDSRSPFRALREELARVAMPATNGDAFGPGAMGFLGYELGRYVEHLPATAVRDIALPDMHLGFYDAVLVTDRRDGSARIVATDVGGRDPEELIAAWLELIESCTGDAGAAQPASTRSAALTPFGELAGNFAADDYRAAIARAIEYIGAGDIFQVNLSQRFTAPLVDDPAELYLRLRRRNPAPYAAYVAGDGWTVLSSSPELFLRVEGRHVATRPIKGTRPRRNAAALADSVEAKEAETSNVRSRAELIASAKDRAELAMIVDLERNDLGRVCSYGSIRVTEPRTIEEYATVFHSVAQVEGRLHNGFDVVDLLRATFPGGSITGAPKVRSMEIIDELEPTCRSVYTGSIGHVGFDGSAELNIAIRTLLVDGDRVHLQVGGGIVADSTPEGEYDETLAKARSLLEALGIAQPQ